MAEVLISSEQVGLFEETIKFDGSVSPRDIANCLVNSKSKLNSKEEIISLIKSSKSNIISNEDELMNITREVIIENQSLVETYRSGKVTVIQALVGAVMKKTQGKADPSLAISLLEAELKN